MPQKRILIVEDEKPLARALELKLGRSGFEVAVAPNGAVALEFLQRERFDLMILDLVMPVMDGFQVLAHIKEKNIGIPVIVTSNLGQEEDRKKVEALGALAYVVKSDTQLSEIVGVIERTFGGSV